jgi:DNA invertase Pin-like site-specific DNA recombinase
MPLRAYLLKAVSSREQATDDKISLSEQERLMREYCQQQGWHVVKVLEIPGHSRSETDIIDLLPEYESAGIYAYHDLRAAWKAKAFDVLVAFDSSRIGRSKSLVTWIFENVIKSGAFIQLIQGGRFDESNEEFGIAMCAISATAGIKRLNTMRKAGMKSRADRGLSTNRLPPTHRIIYDDQGKPLRMEVREELRPIFDAAAKLLLEGEGFYLLPLRMAELGYLNPANGRIFTTSYFWRLFLLPFTWGATALRYSNKEGHWAYDPSVPLPPGVEVNRNPDPPVPPIWTGDKAEKIKAELKRRSSLAGKASPKRSYKFTSLLLCGECNRTISMRAGHYIKRDPALGRNIYWGCTACLSYKRYANPCSQCKQAKDRSIQDQIANLLKRLDALHIYDLIHLRSATPDNSSLANQIQSLTDEITRSHKKLDTLIRRQSSASSEAAEESYQSQINEISDQIGILKSRLRILEGQSENVESRNARILATKDIIAKGESFWQQNPRIINQALHAALGKNRFVLLHGEIVDIR